MNLINIHIAYYFMPVDPYFFENRSNRLRYQQSSRLASQTSNYFRKKLYQSLAGVSATALVLNRNQIMSRPLKQRLRHAARNYNSARRRDTRRNFTYKPRRIAQRRHKRRHSTKPIKQQVRDLTKKVNNGLANHTRRHRDAVAQSVGPNVSDTHEQFITTKSNLLVACNEFRYYDPADPANPLEAAAALGTYHRDISCLGTHTKITVKANYQFPVDISVYLLVPKRDHSIDPVDAWAAGLSSQGDGLLTTNIQMHPTDSAQFNSLWTIKKSIHKILQPGKTLVGTYNHAKFNFDPQLLAAHPDAYQRKYGCCMWMTTIRGVLGHASDGGSIGITNSAVDILYDTKYRFEYDGGFNANDFSTKTDNLTGSPIYTCNAPISDMQTKQTN